MTIIDVQCCIGAQFMIVGVSDTMKLCGHNEIV